MGRKAHLGDEEMMLYVYGGGAEPLGTPLCRTYGRLGRGRVLFLHMGVGVGAPRDGSRK